MQHLIPFPMASAYLSGQYTIVEIAKYFGVHYSTVSQAVRAFETRQMTNVVMQDLTPCPEKCWAICLGILSDNA